VVVKVCAGVRVRNVLVLLNFSPLGRAGGVTV